MAVMAPPDARQGAGDEGPLALHFTSDAGAYLTTTPPER